MTLQFDRGILVGKLANIDEALGKIREVGDAGERLHQWEADDLCVLHLQRAVQATVDLANHLISSNKFETPSDSAGAFEVLARHGVLEAELVGTLRQMVGFRNLAVHRYAQLDMQIVRDVVSTHLGDFVEFASQIAVATGLGDEEAE